MLAPRHPPQAGRCPQWTDLGLSYNPTTTAVNVTNLIVFQARVVSVGYRNLTQGFRILYKATVGSFDPSQEGSELMRRVSISPARPVGKAARPADILGLLWVVALLLWPSRLLAQEVEYYHLDAIGNVRAVTDQSGRVVERHDYLPFGEECITGACASNPGVTGGQPKHFTGKERDTETGLDYFGARY